MCEIKIDSENMNKDTSAAPCSDVDIAFMKEAMTLAKMAEEIDEVPVGAVVHGGGVLVVGHTEGLFVGVLKVVRPECAFGVQITHDTSHGEVG